MLRLALVYSHPMPYTAPLFRELQRRSGIDLTVYFLSDHGAEAALNPQFGCVFKWDVPLLEGYNYRFVPNLVRARGVIGFLSLLNVAIIKELKDNRYDAVLVHGYEHLAKWLAFFAGKRSGARLVLRGESHLNEPRSLLRRAAKGVILRYLFKMCSGVTFIGTLNRKYFEHYGVRPGRLYFAPYSVDNAFFGEGAGLRDDAAHVPSRRVELRRQLGITDEAPIILQVGKLTEAKQPEVLLDAFVRVRSRHRCHLVYVGDGPLRGQIEARVRESSLCDVHITGFVNQSRIPETLACGEVAVLASRHEPWGLAVNEAMAAGLPMIVSNRVGCSVDLVREGVNGYIVPFDDPEELAQRIETLVSNPQLRQEFGARSRELIEEWTIERTADGIVDAARGSGTHANTERAR